MAERCILLSKAPEELAAMLKEMGEPAFRSKQLFSWLHKGIPFDGMTNLSKPFREKLKDICYDLPMRIHSVFASQKDDTVKFLFSCYDGNLIEGVLMHYHYGYSLCVSTQIGCRMGCAFCASTLNGCVRSLESGEILAQVLLANQYLGERGHVGHIVLMGSGEPFDNYDQVMRFLRLVNHPDGLNISLRNISLSTCGLVPQIQRFCDENLPVTLSISLHAPNDTLRKQLMPIANRYALPELMTAVRSYVQKSGRRVVFEYALIDRFNSEEAHAVELAGLLRSLQCHVNLIPLNHVAERNLNPASSEKVQRFLKTLQDLHISATVRREMGADIGGACGQLRRSQLAEMNQQP